MSLAGGDLDRSQASHPSGDGRHPKDEPPGATESHRPDQRHKGYVADDYAASNPWHGQPRSSPVFGLAESLPHTVRYGQGRRHAKREEQHHKCEDDIEKGKTEMREVPPSTPSSRGRDELLDKEDTSHQEDVASRSPEKSRPSREKGEQDTSKTISKDEGDDEEEKNERRQEQREQQASYNRHRNPLARLRARYPEPFAEFLATTITVFLSLCGNLSYRANPSYGTYETLCWTNGFATMAGIYLAGGISGAHISPVVSLVLAIFRGFPWQKFRIYIVAQFLGSLTAGGLAYFVYHDAIHHMDPGLTETTGKSFYTVPQQYITVSSAFWSEFLAIATQMCIIFALGDDQNSPPGAGMNALIIGFVITLLGLTLGNNTGPCLNPMRDFATRLVALMAGYGSQTFRNWWWIGGCWGADIAGAITGAALYDVFIFPGGESPINYLWFDERDNSQD